MSLYIGNLSSRTSRDELESVFQRFGRCNVRLKDGYGFVVYNFPPNAEKALRALQGRNICGKPLTLTWSNKQPRSFNRSTKDARSYEPLHQRSYVKEEEEEAVYRKVQSNGLQDYKFGDKQLGSSHRRLNSVDVLYENASYPWDGVEDDIQEDRHDYGENFPDKGGNVEPNLVDNGRWGEEFHDRLNDNNVENDMVNGKYERYRGFDGKGEDENHQMAYSGSSPALQISREIMEREHPFEGPLDTHNDSKHQQTCYNCGGIGHKMRNCSKKFFSQGKFMRFDHRHGDDINRTVRSEDKLERCRIRSQGKLLSTRDASQHLDDRKASVSRRHQRLIRNESSTKAEEIDTVQKTGHRGKKRHGMDFGNQKKRSEKKANRSVSSSLHSDYTKSRPHSSSQSLKPVPRSGLHSRSRLVSSREHSPSFYSGSTSTSNYFKSKRSKSRSKSCSHTSLSVSASPDQPLLSSPNKVQLDLKGFSGNVASSKSKEILFEQGLQVGDAGLENTQLENDMLVVENENALPSSKVEVVINKDLPMGRDENGNHTVSTSLYEITHPSTKLSETLKETKQQSDASMIVHTSLSMKEQHLEAPDNSHSCRSASTMSLSEEVMLTARSLSSGTLKEAKEHKISDASMMVHVPLPIKNQHSEAPVSSHSGCSSSISSNEMYMVLKHYGLELPDDNERHLPPEAYFGSARLWPWQIIYYRRLKKGPISMENYVRRVSQNQEFGIVDKYIRSSSGWGELGRDFR